MASNFSQIRINIQNNLNEAGFDSTYFTVADINNIIQDAYNMVAIRTQFYIKIVSIPQQVGNYYDMIAAIPDYMGTVAIFNPNTNLWLRDDISLRDFNRARRDWELWTGNSQFWAPHSFNRIAVVPYNTVPIGTLNVIYWALPPPLFADTDIPLVAPDMETLIEEYAMGDLLESAKEPDKALDYFNSFNDRVYIYKDRCKRLARLELLLRV